MHLQCQVEYLNLNLFEISQLGSRNARCKLQRYVQTTRRQFAYSSYYHLQNCLPNQIFSINTENQVRACSTNEYWPQNSVLELMSHLNGCIQLQYFAFARGVVYKRIFTERELVSEQRGHVLTSLRHLIQRKTVCVLNARNKIFYKRHWDSVIMMMLRRFFLLRYASGAYLSKNKWRPLFARIQSPKTSIFQLVI